MVRLDRGTCYIASSTIPWVTMWARESGEVGLATMTMAMVLTVTMAMRMMTTMMAITLAMMLGRRRSIGLPRSTSDRQSRVRAMEAREPS